MKSDPSTRLFGCHVSAAAGLENALHAAMALNVNTIQIHPSPPQRWNSKPFAPGYENKFLELRDSSGVKAIFFHAIYLINLANPDPRMSKLSELSLLHDLDLSARINGDGVIFHVGSLKDEPDEKAGFKRCAEAIDRIMEQAPKKARLILEVAAGAGAVIGDRVEELAEIYSYVKHNERVGFALDSQHLWASGYDLRENLEGVIENIVSVLTPERIWAIHLNDSMTALGSRKDRHENLGQGLIGEQALVHFLNHPKLRAIPLMLETPALKNIETAKSEVEKLRSLVC